MLDDEHWLDHWWVPIALAALIVGAAFVLLTAIDLLTS